MLTIASIISMTPQTEEIAMKQIPEITPEMMEAGWTAFYKWWPAYVEEAPSDREGLVEHVFLAMLDRFKAYRDTGQPLPDLPDLDNPRFDIPARYGETNGPPGASQLIDGD